MMRKMIKGDFLAGLILIGLGIYIIQQALQLDYINEYGPGPGFLPLWLGIGFVVLASSLVVTNVLRPVSHETQKETKKDAWREKGRTLSIWLALMLAIALLDVIGFVFSYALLSAFIIRVMERRSLLTVVAATLCGILFFYVTFIFAFGIPLPVGPWGF